MLVAAQDASCRGLVAAGIYGDVRGRKTRPTPENGMQNRGLKALGRAKRRRCGGIEGDHQITWMFRQLAYGATNTSNTRPWRELSSPATSTRLRRGGACTFRGGHGSRQAGG